MITLSKLAKLANVSVSTASKAFSGSPEVSEETRNMIFAVARENHCFRKFYNAKYPKMVIAIIAPEFSGAYYTRYLCAIQDQLEKENCELCFSTTNFSKDIERSLLEYYSRYANVDGIIVISSYSDTVPEQDIPVVFINPNNEQPDCISVSSDFVPGTREVAAHLRSKDVSSVGFIGEPLTAKKQEFFKNALEEVGIPLKEQFVSISNERFEAGGYQAMEKLFAGKPLPRAIACAYDHMAIGAIRCIYDHGLRVPEDIAIIGFDDIPEATFLNPPLASVSVPVEEICKIATQALINKINSRQVTLHQCIRSEFKLRRSFEL